MKLWCRDPEDALARCGLAVTITGYTDAAGYTEYATRSRVAGATDPAHAQHRASGAAAGLASKVLLPREYIVPVRRQPRAERPGDARR